MKFLAKAKCFRCGVSAIAETFEQAKKQLDHSIGLGRGIKCGDNYGRVQEIKNEQLQKTKQKVSSPSETIIAEPQTEDTSPETLESPVRTEKPAKEKKTRKSKKE